jgi:trehalose 6-phosphate synthase/phosphatase
MVRKRSAPSVPTERMISVLKGLCADARNTVFVVSGKERHSLTNSLQGIPNLGLAAEHGMFISWPTKHVDSKRRWETLVPETDRSWRSLAISIMEVYTSRTHGSYIEETEMKVLWQYRDADTEFGSLQAKELEDHLSKYLRSFPVDILHGGIEEGGYVEVRPKGVNKGVLAMRVVKRFHEIAQKDRVDFALVLGDDHCDEPMLSVMRQIGRRVMDASLAAQGQDPLPPMPATIQLVDVSPCDNFVSPDLEVFTCTVGKKPSAAANYLHDVDEVQELLDSLVKLSTREQRFYSSIDLRSISNEYTPGVAPFEGVMPMGTENAFELPKSVSSIQFTKQHQPMLGPEFVAAPATLKDYYETIKDDETDDEMFF